MPTHEVLNPSAPYRGVNLYTANRPLQDALRFRHPAFDARRFEAMGEECGSAGMQADARLAHAFGPQLKTHHRQGRRIDQVEFDPSYHALLARALPAH